MSTTKVIAAPTSPKAAAAAAETKKSAKSARPVRLNTFKVYEVDVDEDVLKLTTPYDDPAFTSDVHYCAEKFAIDYIAHNGNNDVAFTKLALYKVSKANENEGILVSVIYWDNDTKQVVID